MKRIYNILLAFMAFASVSCVENKIETDIPAAGSGDEVQFGLTLPGLTKTIYGQEVNGAFPIYWVNGDKVQIISPDCLAGRNDAEYKVSVNNAEQKFVTSLTPTGANGVQWGDKPAVFYSVYPSGDYTIADEGNTIQNLKINFSDDFEVDANGVVTPRQADCLMFAKTGEMAIGSPVNLTYSPIATAVILTLNGPTVDTDPRILGRSTKIQSVKLIAPEGTAIAGNFNVTLQPEGPNEGKYVFTEWVKGAQTSNEITAQIFDKATGGFYDIPAGKSVTLSMFLAPKDGLEIKANSDNANDNWRIEVLVQSKITKSPEKEGDANVVTETQKLFTKSLKFTESSTTVLKPGMVHKLPALPNLDVNSESAWNVQDWMTHIPRNVYLSEVSIPGSWDSINNERQSNTSIIEQYNAGVRAFHFDTRWRTSGTGTLFGYTNGSINALSVAGSASSAKLSGIDSNNNRVVLGSAKTFEQLLDDIVSKLSSNEYMVLVCTFAQDSYDYNGTNGKWYSEISTICGKDKYATAIYDAKNITKNTLVGDVIGKLIVIVNMADEVEESTALPADSKCLFTYMPQMLTIDHFNGKDDNQDALWVSTTIEGVNKAKDTDMLMYNSQAQISSSTGTGIDTGTGNRGYAPSVAERKAILNKILSWSRSNYTQVDYQHNMWIYLGLGGYQTHNDSGSTTSGSNNVIAETFNTWINEKVTEMGTTPEGQSEKVPYYPVGIVLMNFVNDYASTVKNILLLNNAYRLQYDPDKPADYKPALTSTAASYSSGMHDQNVAAFGWD